MIDIDFIYSLSVNKLNKLHNFQTARSESDSLRKFVLLNNFFYKKFPSGQDDLSEWSEEDIKKDEESWFESCMEELEEDGYVYVNKPFDDSRNYNAQDNNTIIQNNDVIDNNTIEQRPPHLPQPNFPSENVIIPHDLLHLPYFGQVINEPQHQLKDTTTTSSFKTQHQLKDTTISSFKKDNVNISYSPSTSPPFHSFCLPEIFRNFCPSSQRRTFDDSELLQPDYNYCQPLEAKSPSKRSKDDLDILHSKNKDLDRRALMKVIKMLEYYGGKKYYEDDKTNHKSSEIDNNNNIWFISNY